MFITKKIDESRALSTSRFGEDLGKINEAK